MNDRITSLFLIFLSTLFISCESPVDSTEINQESIYSKLQLSYSAGSNTTEVRARFSLESDTGTGIILTNPSHILFNDNLLPQTSGTTSSSISSTTSLVYYSLVFDSLIESGTYQFTDLENNLYINNISLVDTLSFVIPNNTLNKDSNNTITWNGPSLQPNEVISLIIMGIDSTSNYFMHKHFVNDTVGSNSIYLPSDELQALENFEHFIWITRTKIEPIIESTSAGGELISSFKSKTLPISVQ